MRHPHLAILLTLTTATAASAQTPGALPLTLDEALARGVETSLRLVEADARTEAATAVVAQRAATARPQVSAQAGYSRTNHVEEFGIALPNNQVRVIYPDIPDNILTRLSVSWPIYTSGRQEAVERAARTEVSALSSERAALRADLRLEITRAYWALVTATDAVRVMTQALDRTRAHFVDVRNQLDAGLAAQNDVLAVEAQEARQRMLAIRAGVNRGSAEADLARLVGAPPGTSIVPATPLETGDLARPAPPPSLETLVEEAHRQRADRAAMVEWLSAGETLRQAASAGRRPTVALAGGVDYGRPNPNIFPRQGDWQTSWDAGINVVWPLSDGGRSNAEAAEADARVRAMRARLDEFDRVLAVEIGHRLRELEASRAAIDASDAGVRAATEARRVAADRFDAGVATSTDVLIAEGALLQAEFDRTEALAATHLAEARLERVLGR